MNTLKDIYTDKDASVPPPDLKVQRIKGNQLELEVWFTWHDQEQWVQMFIESDGSWSIVEEKFTEDFGDWLYEGDGQGYDSLEDVFSILHPASNTFEIVA
jgi:hypothetical protein